MQIGISDLIDSVFGNWQSVFGNWQLAIKIESHLESELTMTFLSLT